MPEELPTIDMSVERGDSKCRVIVEGSMVRDFEFFKAIIDLQSKFKQRAEKK